MWQWITHEQRVLGELGRVSWICGFCEAFRLERWERWWEAGLPDSGAARTPKREGVR